MNLDNLFFRMSEMGINAKQLSEATGISTGNISDWKSGRSAPTASKLIILADYLDCSIDYLLGRQAHPSSQSNVDTSQELSQKEKAVLLAYRSHPEMQNAVDTLLNVPPVNDIATDMANVMAKGEEIFGKMRTKVK